MTHGEFVEVLEKLHAEFGARLTNSLEAASGPGTPVDRLSDLLGRLVVNHDGGHYYEILVLQGMLADVAQDRGMEVSLPPREMMLEILRLRKALREIADATSTTHWVIDVARRALEGES